MLYSLLKSRILNVPMLDHNCCARCLKNAIFRECFFHNFSARYAFNRKWVFRRNSLSYIVQSFVQILTISEFRQLNYSILKSNLRP